METATKNNTAEAQKFMDRNETAAFTKVSAKSLDKFRKQKKLKASLIGTRVVYDRSDLIAFMESRKA